MKGKEKLLSLRNISEISPSSGTVLEFQVVLRDFKFEPQLRFRLQSKCNLETAIITTMPYSLIGTYIKTTTQVLNQTKTKFQNSDQGRCFSQNYDFGRCLSQNKDLGLCFWYLKQGPNFRVLKIETCSLKTSTWALFQQPSRKCNLNPYFVRFFCFLIFQFLGLF